MAQRYDAYEIKYARVNATADGDNSIITGVSEKSIVVLGYALNANAAGVVTLQDSAATPNVHASFALAANGSVSYAGGTNCPAFKIAVGNGLEVNNAAGVDTLGHVSYILVS